MKLKICFLALLCLFFKASAQEKIKLQSLKIGDKVPEVTLSNILNYPEQAISLSKLKGKLVIIDFWTTWCSNCIESMPEIKALNKHFGDKIQIISVNSQSRSQIEKFINHNDFVKSLRLTMALGDSTLDRLFPHRYFPHIAWIDKDGTYLGATTQKDLTATMIKAILSGEPFNFSEPKNDDMVYNPDKPLFEDGNGGTPKLFYRSTLAAAQAGLPSTIGKVQTGDSVTIVGTNISLIELYCEALSFPAYRLSANRIIYADSTFQKSVYPVSSSTPNTNIYCFELIVKGLDVSNVQSLMLSQLENWFSIRASIEKRVVTCFELSAVQESSALEKVSIKSATKASELLSVLMANANKDPSSPILMNSKHLAAGLSIEKPKSLDINTINNCLRPYGFEFKKETKAVDMMIVSYINH